MKIVQPTRIQRLAHWIKSAYYMNKGMKRK